VGGYSPVLTEALIRKKGAGVMPQPAKLLVSDLLKGEHDSRLVCVEAVLVEHRDLGAQQILELQAEHRTFRAILPNGDGKLDPIPEGSRVRITGICQTEINRMLQTKRLTYSFGLLLRQSADVVVLERPPWWNWKHTLAVVGVLVMVLLGALIWIRILKKQVVERTHQLCAIERERSRIAKDLHDEFGSRLTRMTLLSRLVQNERNKPEAVEVHARKVASSAQEMVRLMDEIVWAVNPTNDALNSLATYISRFARDFLEDAGVTCRLDIPVGIPSVPIPAETRHHLFLVVEEALNNSVKHARATEVRIRVAINDGDLEIGVEDNGCGFAQASVPSGRKGNGLANMHQRMQSIGGVLGLDSTPGGGTRIALKLRLPTMKPLQTMSSPI
jgi:two-component sensor histidine kinase